MQKKDLGFELDRRAFLDTIRRRLDEIYRQAGQREYPHDPVALLAHLDMMIKGLFGTMPYEDWGIGIHRAWISLVSLADKTFSNGDMLARYARSIGALRTETELNDALGWEEVPEGWKVDAGLIVFPEAVLLEDGKKSVLCIDRQQWQRNDHLDFHSSFGGNDHYLMVAHRIPNEVIAAPIKEGLPRVILNNPSDAQNFQRGMEVWGLLDAGVTHMNGLFSVVEPSMGEVGQGHIRQRNSFGSGRGGTTRVSVIDSNYPIPPLR
jgi:hypothetical protein